MPIFLFRFIDSDPKTNTAIVTLQHISCLDSRFSHGEYRTVRSSQVRCVADVMVCPREYSRHSRFVSTSAINHCQYYLRFAKMRLSKDPFQPIGELYPWCVVIWKVLTTQCCALHTHTRTHARARARAHTHTHTHTHARTHAR